MLGRRHFAIDRRSGADRRKAHDLDRSLNGGIERRSVKGRRSPLERRRRWVRVSEWASVSMKALGIQVSSSKAFH